MRHFLVAVIVSCALAAVPVASAQTITKDKAFRTARACLIRSGATYVTRRTDGGGGAIFGREAALGGKGSTFWTYKTILGAVESVKVYFMGEPGLPASGKRIVAKCLTAGL